MRSCAVWPGGDVPPLPDLNDDPVLALSLATSHPSWLVKRWLKRLGLKATQARLTAHNQIPPLTIRVNTLKTDPETLKSRLADEGVEAVAVCFLHSYRYPRHEQIAAECLCGRRSTGQD